MPAGKGNNPQSATTSMHLGAAQGLTVWVAYAVVEYFVITIVEGIYRPIYIFPSWHWGLTLLMFGIYASTGLIVGSVAGLAVHLTSRNVSWLGNRDPGALRRAAVLLSLVVAFCANITYHYQLPRSPLTAFALLVSLVLALAVAQSTRSVLWARRLAFLTNPCTASFLLVGPLWMIKSIVSAETQATKLAAPLALSVAVLLVVFLGQRIWASARGSKRVSATRPSLARAFVRLAPVVLIVLAASVFIDQRFPPKRLNLSASSRVAGSPNVIWIVLDSVRADHLSVYGYKRETTPNLRKLSEEATVYADAIAPSDYTLPSHA